MEKLAGDGGGATAVHSHLAGPPLRGKFNGVVLLKIPVLFINHAAKEATSPPSSSSTLGLGAGLKHVCLFSKEVV